MDAANIDLKAFTESFYKQVCTGSLDAVLDTLVHVKHESKTWLEITNLLIPGKNDSSAELAALCEWMAERLGPDVPLHLTAFHPDWKMLDVPQTPPSTLKRAREIALSTGLRYVYTGNVHDEAGQSTYCHSCGARLIGRDWYIITAWNLDRVGCCAACGETCPGLFEALPGSWGARREPVVIAAA
jgi:pyruvate formate lyase activating enzyme